jgi:Aerolysin toxin
MLRILLPAIVLLLTSQAAWSLDQQDARAFISNLLTQYGPLPITTPSTQICRTTCGFVSNEIPFTRASFTTFGQQGAKYEINKGAEACPSGAVPMQSCSGSPASTTRRVLGFGQVQMTQVGEIKYGNPIFRDIPDELYVDGIVVQNCSAGTQVSHQSLQLSIANTNSTTITKTVTNATALSLSVKAGIASFLEVTGGVTYTETVQSATAQSTGVTTTAATTDTVDVSVPSKTTMIARLQAYKQHGQVPFSVDAVLDAPLERNDPGYQNVSAIIGADKRTVTITGHIELSGSTEARVSYGTLKYDQSKCIGDPTKLKTTSANNDKFMLQYQPKGFLAPVESRNAIQKFAQ